VISGKKTAGQVLMEFLEGFDVGGEVDGKVTAEEFENYYGNISASIDNDDYFELMIRNAWHISGGEGWCANSSNRRVLVTDKSGNQSVQEIKSDLGLKSDDKTGMMARLRAQGLDLPELSAVDTSYATADKTSYSDNSFRRHSQPSEVSSARASLGQNRRGEPPPPATDKMSVPAGSGGNVVKSLNGRSTGRSDTFSRKGINSAGQSSVADNDFESSEGWRMSDSSSTVGKGADRRGGEKGKVFAGMTLPGGIGESFCPTNNTQYVMHMQL
jgi:hypothetical protein